MEQHVVRFHEDCAFNLKNMVSERGKRVAPARADAVPLDHPPRKARWIIPHTRAVPGVQKMASLRDQQ